jgi:Transposase IS66 family
VTPSTPTAPIAPSDAAIDAQARDENMNFAARHALRMERAPSVLSELKAQIEAASRTALPSSPLGKAAAYTLRLWHKFTRFLDYAELELSNNLAENSMRPVAMGRRNCTHIGHEKAGPRIAAILSIVETWRRLKIPAPEYLAAVRQFPRVVESCRRLRICCAAIWLRSSRTCGLAPQPIQRLGDLTPAAWVAQHS